MTPPGGDFAGVLSAPGTAGTGPAPRRVRWSRAALVHAGTVAFALALVGRAAQVQLLERDAWRARARAQQLAAVRLPAPRGRILDVNGAVLVESRQLLKVSVAPREVAADVQRVGDGAQRMAAVTRALARAGVPAEWLARVRDTSRAWVEIPGRFLATDIASLTTMRGVHTEPALERVPPANDGLRRLVGRADDAGGPVDGLEKSLDGVLRGTGGTDALVRDARGQRIRSPGVAAAPPLPGHTVTLTISRGLQDIAERALDDAVTTMHAAGGDIVVLDPTTGEVRAMASRRGNALSAGATALTEPYEPGSTLKPFVAARLLDMGRARPDEVVSTYNGKWELDGRKIEDDHPMPRASLADVIRYSSNIGIVQFAQRLSHDEQFEMLRDLGFGTPTGLPYPVESPGTLPPPRRWDALTPASLAMGYAVTVTPLQLALAYGAIANGGELLEPAIVHEVRSPDGALRWRHQRRVVRRVMTSASARALRSMLKGVVETGTAAGSNLATFDVAGKTGTAKLTENGKYVGKYTASFVGMFPADEPQLVILVKLDNPTKSIYGGKAAAPVSKVVLQAALAARDAALDRGALVGAAGRGGRMPQESAGAAPIAREAPASGGMSPSPVVGEGSPGGHGAVAAATMTADELAAGVGAALDGGAADTWVVRLGDPREPAPPAVVLRPVPDVRGLPARRAVLELHRAGFRASFAGGTGADRAGGTVPAAGTRLAIGSRVVLERER
jgi:cell division protein FtsI (penicillin-binding protein 3)